MLRTAPKRYMSFLMVQVHFALVGLTPCLPKKTTISCLGHLGLQVSIVA